MLVIMNVYIGVIMRMHGSIVMIVDVVMRFIDNRFSDTPD
jgi:hypothetical protein